MAVSLAAAARPERARDSTVRSAASIRTVSPPFPPGTGREISPSASSRRFTSAPGRAARARRTGCIRFPSFGPRRRKSGRTIHSRPSSPSARKTTSFTFNSSASRARYSRSAASRSPSARSAIATVAAASGCRTRIPCSVRTRRPSEAISRTAAISSFRRSSRGKTGSGQSVRWTLSGASLPSGPATRFRWRSSARKGVSGAAIRETRVSASWSVVRASRFSGSRPAVQKRRRLRRSHQFESDSAKAASARAAS